MRRWNGWSCNGEQILQMAEMLTRRHWTRDMSSNTSWWSFTFHLCLVVWCNLHYLSTAVPIQPIIRIPLCPNIDRRIVEASYLNILGWVLLIPAPRLSSSDVIGTSDNNVSGDGDSYSSYSSYNTSYSLRKHQQPSLFFLLRQTKHTDRKTCITDKVVFTKYVMRLIFFVNILDRLLIQSICLGGQVPSAV